MRKLTLDICNYEGESVCQLYDNQTNVLGQATDVYIQTERNGWKQLSFSLPSTYETDESKERNHRLDYLIANWLIKAEDDYETDWYVISEPRISHNAFSNNYDVIAGHISQTLKNKNLGLEFSEDEGNNIGTALELLRTILDGTGWTPGNVAKFMEDDDPTKEKKRTLNAQAKTGAFKMITDMCDLFEAKPTFHGDKTVDILPLNPFSREIWYENDNLCVGRPIVLEQGETPEAAKTGNILELQYDKNVTGLARTINTDNLITKLTAQVDVSSTLEPVSLSEAKHLEYVYEGETIQQDTERYFIDYNGDKHYFTAIQDINGYFVYSSLDYLSQSYIWDGEKVHPVYRLPKTTTAQQVEVQYSFVQNWFSYLMNFNYYVDIGLFKQNMLDKAAEFQRIMPAYLEESYNKNLAFSDEKGRLSEIGEAMSGFLKLRISSAAQIEGNLLKLVIDQTIGDDGVIYRSDYAEPRRKYFSWYVANELKENGDSVNNVGSVIYIIQDRGEELPPLWVRGYLRSVDDITYEYKDIDGNVSTRYANYIYTATNDSPEFVTTFIDWDTYTGTFNPEPNFFSQDNVYVYLFCTNSMVGKLGEKFMMEESVLESLKSQTKEVTEVHPTYFADYYASKLPNNPSQKTSTYAFGYVRKKDDFGDFYMYCYGVYPDIDTWSRVYIGTEAPNSYVPRSYFYNTREAKLYCIKNNKWTYMDSFEEKKMTQNVAKALYFCLRRDMVYKGLYEKYVYTVPNTQTNILPAGNYAIETPYYFYWFFTTTITMDGSNLGSERYDISDESIMHYNLEEGMYISQHLPITAGAWYEYHIKKELEIITYDAADQLVAHFSGSGDSVFRAHSIASYFIVKTKEIPEEGYINGKDSCSIWIDTSKDVLYQENSIANVVEAQVKRYDTVEYPSKNLLADTTFVKGSIDKKGVDQTSEIWQRSYNIDLYSATDYEFYLPVTPECKVFIYDANKKLTDVIYVDDDDRTKMCFKDVTKADTDPEQIIMISMPEDEDGHKLFAYHFKTKLNTGYAKVIYYNGSHGPDTSKYYLRVQDYENKLFAAGKCYTILRNVTETGQQNGLNKLIRLYTQVADSAYLSYLPDLEIAQAAVKENETNLATLLGDMYREGWWHTNQYTKEELNKLYSDALSNLKEISKPETTYEVTFLDTYGANDDDEFYVDEHTAKFDYNDIQSSDIVHLIDPSINVDLWAYIDLLKKCYDAPWKTSLEINTSLSDISQHSFTDVMSYIAEVSQKTKAKQSIYERAVNINPDGTIMSEKISGDISTAANKLDGANSNWYTDDNGNIVIESQDGLSAMKLTGAGFLIASSKNEYGEWNWRNVGDGEGILADSISGGEISGSLIKAGTLNTNAVVSDFGQSLDIASNNALFLYATIDGIRPAGSLETYRPRETDSYIIIHGADEETSQKAYIDIASGGKVNLYSGSEINIETGGKFKATGANVDISAFSEINPETGETETTKGIVNIEGSDINVKANSKVNITADPNTGYGEVFIGAGGKTTISSGGEVSISSGGTFNISATAGQSPAAININSGGKVRVNAGSSFRIHADTGFSVDSPCFKITETPKRDYMPTYKNWDYMTLEEKEEYLDTLTANKKDAELYVKGNGEFTGKITASDGEIGGFTITGTSIYNGPTSIDDLDHTGIYMGTDGFKLVASKTVEDEQGSHAEKYDALKLTNNEFTIDLTGTDLSSLELNADNVFIGNVSVTETVSTMNTNINGKPNIYFSSTKPSATDKNDGDIWINTTDYSQSVCKSKSWQAIDAIQGAYLKIDASKDSGTIQLFTSSGGSTSAVTMGKDGIEIGSNAAIDIKGGSINIETGGGLNIEAGGTLKIKANSAFYISATGFLVDVGPNSTDTITLGGWKAKATEFTSSNGMVSLISKSNEAAIGIRKQVGGTYNISLDTTGLYVGQDGASAYYFVVDQNGRAFCNNRIYAQSHRTTLSESNRIYGYKDLVDRLRQDGHIT